MATGGGSRTVSLPPDIPPALRAAVAAALAWLRELEREAGAGEAPPVTRPR
ncbi:MAG TPA: hypothetical protein VN635_06235 [Conexibacter sp.]|nr:hypothetical protein [Conexibacter sp.]